jgi:hypothetical protein
MKDPSPAGQNRILYAAYRQQIFRFSSMHRPIRLYDISTIDRALTVSHTSSNHGKPQTKRCEGLLEELASRFELRQCIFEVSSLGRHVRKGGHEVLKSVDAYLTSVQAPSFVVVVVSRVCVLDSTKCKAENVSSLGSSCRAS